MLGDPRHNKDGYIKYLEMQLDFYDKHAERFEMLPEVCESCKKQKLNENPTRQN